MILHFPGNLGALVGRWSRHERAMTYVYPRRPEKLAGGIRLALLYPKQGYRRIDYRRWNLGRSETQRCLYVGRHMLALST